MKSSVVLQGVLIKPYNHVHISSTVNPLSPGSFSFYSQKLILNKMFCTICSDPGLVG